MEASTPESIIEYEPKYADGAWRNYSISELGSIVAFFVKRSGHRSEADKKVKDLLDAQNYLNMIQAHVTAAKEGFGVVIALLDNGQDLNECAAELGCEVGQLLTPLTRYRLRNPDRPWGIDNGFFSPNASIEAWLSLLEREKHHQKKCLFVTLPDVVGSARRTLEVFEHWRRKEALRGWKRALVCQDGQEDLPMPWDDVGAIFLGGSTNWKCGPHAVHLIKAAKAFGIWVHAGRVNGPERWEHFEKLGVDSCDGTGLAKYSHMRERIANRHEQQGMFA